MQFTLATLTNLFASALSAPTEVAVRSDISARQITFTAFAGWSQSEGKEGDYTGTVNLSTQTTCQDFPVGIVSGQVVMYIPTRCQIVFYVGIGCTSG